MKKAAQTGYELACTDLGKMYGSGSGCEEDVKAAVNWIRRGAEMGNIEAMRLMETLYWHGVQNNVLERNAEKAEFWKNKADIQEKINEQNSPLGCNRL
jgi:TPR repeat protein